MNDPLLKRAIELLPIPRLWKLLGIRGEPRVGRNIHSPLRKDDENPSFSIYADGRRAKDHGTGWDGDSFDFYQACTGKSAKEAFRPFVELAGLGSELSNNGFDWSCCVSAVTEDYLFELGMWRGYSPDFCRWLKHRGYIGRHHNCWALPVKHNGRVVAAHFRRDKHDWPFEPTLRSLGIKNQPLVIGDLTNATKVFIAESQWDLFCLLDKTLGYKTDAIAGVASRGATNAKVLAGLVPQKADVYLLPQNDEPGRKWLEDTIRVIAKAALVVRTPKEFNDFNEWATDGAANKALIESVTGAELVEPATNHVEPSFAKRIEQKQDEQKESVLPALIEAYYDSPRKEYLTRNAGGRWHSLDQAGFRLRLRERGYATAKPQDGLLSPADKEMLRIQNQFDVQYAGPLSGRKAGFYEENGTRILVKDSPKIVEPRACVWNLLERVFRNAISGHSEPWAEQEWIVFHGWLRTARQALRVGRFQPGQALVLAGEVDSGKSLIQAIITEILGGRSAKAAMFLQGRTDFNSELFGAEHLMLEDEAASTSHQARSALGAAIKAIAVNKVHPCHGKGRDIVNLCPWWRLTISLNSEPERMLIIPRLTPDVSDKIILLRVIRHPMPIPVGTADQKESFWNQLMNELPGYLDWLENEFEIPADFRSERFGVREFHHPELVEALDELSPANTLLDLIDQAKPWEVDTEWEGPATELRQILCNNDKTRRDAERILYWTNACGQYLGELEKTHKDRLKSRRVNGRTKWRILPPIL
jgi:hypothetical protein